ncbi:MAG: alpha/beta hydrolase [Saprospiraceae bacterium]
MNRFTLASIGSALNALAVFSPMEAGKRILQLFSTPRSGRLRPQDRTFLETAAWGQLQVQNLDVQYYLWEKSGPTVLLVHGWESNSARWKVLIQRLKKKNYRVVAVDAPAHGASGGSEFNAVLYADFIAAATEKFRPDFAIGHSAGGMALAYFMLHHPGSFRKVALLAMPSDLRQITGVFGQVLGLSARAMQGYTEQVHQKFGHTLDYFSIAEFAKSMSTECLIIHGRDDMTAPFADAERVAQNWAGAQLIAMDGLGHSLQGEAVYKSILQFLGT